MALSATTVDRLQPKSAQYKVPDAGGLHILVRPNGAKLWQMRYRFGGAEKTASLGQYPAVGLAEARKRRDEAKRELAAGEDPTAVKKAAKHAAAVRAANRFELIAREWHAQWSPAKSKRHAGDVMKRLEKDVFPAIGSSPIASIEAPRLVAMVKKIEARGAGELAKRAMGVTGQVFRYAIAHGKGGVTRNPVADVKPNDVLKPRVKRNYARIDAKDLPELLRKIEGYPGTPSTRLAMKLMAHTFVRTSELIGARWEEFDLAAGRWDLPAHRVKMVTPHIVPLSPQALQVLRVLKDVSGHRDLLFPGERDHSKPMSNNTILGALERMGYAGRMTGHGFRGIASTVLHEHGFDHTHIELQLAHMERDGVSAAYNHALYLQQRTAMMHWWSEYLEGLERGNVSPLRRLAA